MYDLIEIIVLGKHCKYVITSLMFFEALFEFAHAM